MKKMLKGNNSPNLLPVVIMSIMAITFSALGQTGWETGLQRANSGAMDYIKPLVQLGLFIIFLWKALAVFIQRDKEHNWFALLSLIGAIIFVTYADDLYTVIVGSNPLGATTGP
jgi:hypothetical protein